MKINRYNDLGKADYGWLRTSYHFSFSNYYDPLKMKVGTLRVLNDDYIDKHSGFDTHPHHNMEIITYVVDGELTHKDSMNNKRTISGKHIQYMSAGTGITHSEYNESDKELHLYQIWIFPRAKGLTPNYGDKDFSDIIKHNQFTLLVTGETDEEAITINQDATIEVGLFDQNQEVIISNGEFQYTYLVLIDGELEVDGKRVYKGDSIESESLYNINIIEDSHFLLLKVNELKR